MEDNFLFTDRSYRLRFDRQSPPTPRGAEINCRNQTGQIWAGMGTMREPGDMLDSVTGAVRF